MGLNAAIYGKDEQKLAGLRIGNIAQVDYLRRCAVCVLGEQSIVVSKVLYDGTHSGDSLAVTELAPFAAELQLLRRSSEAEVQTFACDMLELVHTALHHATAIYF